MRIHGTRRDEEGAVAVTFAIMTLLLFIVAAMAVDLGNAWSRKTDTQNQADFGAFNVGVTHALEIASGVPGTHPTDPVLNAIAAYFNENRPQDDQGYVTVTADHLRDGGAGYLANGDATYTTTGLRITSPEAWVQFGFANLIQVPGRQVQSQATVSVFTAGPRVFPVFAIDAPCGASDTHNEGFQTVKETANGQTNPPAAPPPLLHPAPYNATVLTKVEMFDANGAKVDAFAVGSTGNGIKVTGTNWGPTTEVAFFQTPDKIQPASFAVATPIPTSTPANTPQTYDVAVPDAVVLAAGVWYVRVKNEGTGPNVGWSAPTNNAVAIVDPATIIPGCPPSGSDQGNFGVVDFPRSGNLNDGNEVALNLVKGTENPFGVTVHSEASASAAAGAWKCAEPTDNANESDPNPEPKTNCLSTVTGLTMDPYQEGLVDGYGTDKGLLDTDNASVCGGSRQTVNTQSGTRNLNNEPLSCYLQLPTGVTLDDISKMGYSGASAFKPEIYKSARFGYVPIFRGDPAGLTGSETRSIVGFQAAFITDNPVDGAGADGVHGLVFRTKPNGKQELEAVNMFLFGIGALPDPPDDAALINYLGVGDPVVHLVD